MEYCGILWSNVEYCGVLWNTVEYIMSVNRFFLFRASYNLKLIGPIQVQERSSARTHVFMQLLLVLIQLFWGRG